MRAERPLLVIAPNLYFAAITARHFGIDPVLAKNLRPIHRPEMLRGWSPGTPYIALPTGDWPQGGESGRMAEAFDACVRLGRFRPASETEINQVMGRDVG